MAESKQETVNRAVALQSFEEKVHASITIAGSITVFF
jgi:hypothetical protein